MRVRPTPLHLAAKSCLDSTAILALLEGGAELEAKDRRGQTALHYAAQNSRAAAVSALVDAGANVNAADREGRTPLHWAPFSRSGAAKWDSWEFTFARRCFPDHRLEGIAGVIETVRHQAELVKIGSESGSSTAGCGGEAVGSRQTWSCSPSLCGGIQPESGHGVSTTGSGGAIKHQGQDGLNAHP